MDYLSWHQALNSFQERLEQRTIIFHAISPNMDDYDSETQFFQVVFVLKAFVNSYKDVTLVLGLSDQLRIGKGCATCSWQHLQLDGEEMLAEDAD